MRVAPRLLPLSLLLLSPALWLLQRRPRRPLRRMPRRALTRGARRARERQDYSGKHSVPQSRREASSNSVARPSRFTIHLTVCVARHRVCAFPVQAAPTASVVEGVPRDKREQRVHRLESPAPPGTLAPPTTSRPRQRRKERATLNDSLRVLLLASGFPVTADSRTPRVNSPHRTYRTQAS